MTSKRCVYCGGVADTKDHIPSRNLFPKGASNTSFLLVPSCGGCNNSFSKDEEYFRNLIVSMLYDESITATYVADTAMTRSITKRPALAWQMFKKMSLVHFYRKGAYLGIRTAYHLADDDYPKVDHVLDKYTKALYFLHVGHILPDSWFTRHFWVTRKNESVFRPFFSSMTWITVKENVFGYSYWFETATKQGVLAPVFYGCAPFFTMIFEKEPQRVVA